MTSPRVEYPLDGEWRFVADPEDDGLRRRWFASAPAGGEPVHVPARDLPGKPPRIGWYFCRFTAEPSESTASQLIRFEAAIYEARAWLNGEEIGASRGAWTAFTCDATPAICSGENLLAVRVVGAPKAYAAVQKPLLWGSVHRLQVPRRGIAQVYVRPDIRGRKLRVHMETAEPGRTRVEIAEAGVSAEGEADVVSVEWADFEFWSPETPRLYTLRITHSADDSEDAVEIPFAMRELSIAETAFTLNNRRRYLRGVHFPLTPERLWMAEPEAVDAVLKGLAARANLVYFAAPPPARVLEQCATVGLMAFVQPFDAAQALDAEASSAGWQRVREEMTEAVLQHVNAPAVAAWVLPGPNVAGDRDDLAATLRELDPTRLIIDLQSAGQEAASARFLRPYSSDWRPMDAAALRAPMPLPADLGAYLRYGAPEHGVWLLHMLEAGAPWRISAAQAEAVFEQAKLQSLFTEPKEMLQAIHAIRRDAMMELADFCSTSTAFAGHFAALGPADLAGGPASAPGGKAAEKARIAIDLSRNVATPREEVDVAIHLLGKELSGRCELSLQVVGPTNQVLWKKKRGIRLPVRDDELWSGTISASGAPGRHRFVVRVSQSGRVVVQAEAVLHVFAAPERPSEAVRVIEPSARHAEALGDLVQTTSRQAPVYFLPPLANRIGAYPADALAQGLAEAAEGAVLIVFEPPEDWAGFAAAADEALRCGARKSPPGAVHYARLHPVFEGLPSRCLLDEPFRRVIPETSFAEETAEDICGALLPDAAGPAAAQNILVKRYGSGRVVFVSLRLFSAFEDDPLAARLIANLVRHFARRAVPSEEPAQPRRFIADWLASERRRLRRWEVVGPFANPAGAGFDEAFPPEQELDFGASYPGRHGMVRWRSWHTHESDQHWLDLNRAVLPDWAGGADYGVFYAQAEFTAAARAHGQLALDCARPCKVWLNGRLLYAGDAPPEEAGGEIETPLSIKQGRNSVLVKVARGLGGAGFRLNLVQERTPMDVVWRR